MAKTTAFAGNIDQDPISENIQSDLRSAYTFHSQAFLIFQKRFQMSVSRMHFQLSKEV